MTMIPGDLYRLITREPKTICCGDPDDPVNYYYVYDEILIFIGDTTFRAPYVGKVFWRTQTGKFVSWDKEMVDWHLDPLVTHRLENELDI